MRTLKEISQNPSLAKNSPLAKKTIYNNLNEKIVKDIFLQLTVLCYFYSKYKFNHGEPSINYINFSPSSVNFVFQDIHIVSKIKLVLCPSTHSSITYNNTRYYYYKDKDLKDTIYIENKDIGLDEQNYSGDYNKHRIVYYKIGNCSAKFLESKTYSGNTNFQSFDFIIFFASLITDKYYFDSFKENPKLLYIWKKLWKKDEYDRIMKDLKSIQRNNFLNVFNVVKKYYVREDALQFSAGCLYDL